MIVLVTGAAGFIGSHVAQALLARGERVVGIDNMNNYYDPKLKQVRIERLSRAPDFSFRQIDVCDRASIRALFEQEPDLTDVVHLAAQAGVRYSMIDPYSYVDSNIMGQVVLLEACRRLPRLRHMVYASSSSVYGANAKLPFSVEDRVDSPISLYAATKRSGELIAEAYARLYGIALTGLRFFTVYGPWGRPDMAAYIFAKAIFEDRPIEIYNQGRSKRDFTFIDDVVAGVLAALDRPPAAGTPHRLYNLGNNRTEELMRFIALIEQACGRQAKKTYCDMQPGDVAETTADIEPARRDLGYRPRITIDQGIPRFIDWYRDFHGC